MAEMLQAAVNKTCLPGFLYKLQIVMELYGTFFYLVMEGTVHILSKTVIKKASLNDIKL